jgi:hypothetical protein
MCTPGANLTQSAAVLQLAEPVRCFCALLALPAAGSETYSRLPGLAYCTDQRHCVTQSLVGHHAKRNHTVHVSLKPGPAMSPLNTCNPCHVNS